MNPAFLIVTFLILGVAVYIILNNKDRLLKRKLKKEKTRPIDSFLDGETGKIVGRVEYFEEFLYAPLTERRCAYFQVKVRKTGKNSYLLVEEENALDFLVNDGKNVALIKTQHIQAVLKKDMTAETGFWAQTPPRFKQFLKERGKNSQGIFGITQSLEYQEGVLQAGETASIIGTGTWQKAEGRLAEKGLTKILVIEGTKENPVLISDLPSTH